MTAAPQRDRLARLVGQFAGKRLLVVGDMVADEYILGAPLKVSREAPVLVLGQRDAFTVPGGATNPGVNARTLGANVYLSGVIGDDASGHRLLDKLHEYGAHTEGLFCAPERPTYTKTRVLAGDRQLRQQQIVRVDLVSDDNLSDEVTERMQTYIGETLPQVDAVILSDYENGVISPAIIGTVLPLARKLEKIVVVDSHGDLARFKGVTALTPNQPEAEATLGESVTNMESLERAGERLLQMTESEGVLITRGSEGMSLFERGRAPVHLPVSDLTRGTEIFDPTGAGDTVAATFTLALTAGAAMADAAALANIAAGLVVRRLGCATNTPEELLAAIQASAPD
ncbi:MAG TPA: bifunctional ADP-heptose synthase [Ktedonobacterales bacterium]